MLLKTSRPNNDSSSHSNEVKVTLAALRPSNKTSDHFIDHFMNVIAKGSFKSN
jgi:hypothetical protein